MQPLWSIMAEQIAQEIDHLIYNDLITKYRFWRFALTLDSSLSLFPPWKKLFWRIWWYAEKDKCYRL